ncbi:MAG TPA: hypothetical protein VNQ57_05300, partial [Ureibacillus sp.]|nr:hypothetical protein [Ureibacillus sp.]
GLDFTIFVTFLICSALATDVPPNLHTIISPNPYYSKLYFPKKHLTVHSVQILQLVVKPI